MNADQKIRVFLVDDVNELRMLVRLTLEEDPQIEVVGEARDGRAGVAGVAETQPDVVLVDLSMPDMDGLEALPLMREQAPGARLVVLSGHEAGRISLEALQQGATRYVNKASDLKTLLAVVRDVAQLEPPLTDSRFGIVRNMWTDFLDGAVDSMLAQAANDASWRPYTAGGREIRSRSEMRDYIEELMSEGRVVDPRAYGVEPFADGLIVLGTLEIRGPNGMSETEVFWAFCFRDRVVSLAAGFDQRAEAQATLREACPA
jgi:DNA-binding NarL/FixJ family response regulator